MSTKVLRALAPLLVPVLLAGCGDGQNLTLVPVKGKVEVDGQPLASGNVVLHLDSTDKSLRYPLSAGMVKDGNYEIFTDGKLGAPVNKFKVTVSQMTVPGNEAGAPFDKKFSDQATTPLSVEVVASPQPGQYDLKLTK